MTDKKLTDEEIIKALEGSILNAKWCDSKAWSIEIYKLESALDLINRQKAEYENLDTKLKAMRGAANSYKAENERLNEIIKNCHKEILQKCDSCNNRIKTEAYKEFAERLKNEINVRTTLSREQDKNVIHMMYNLLKEMVGEEE